MYGESEVERGMEEPPIQRQQMARWGWNSPSVRLLRAEQSLLEDSQCRSQVVKEVGESVLGAGAEVMGWVVWSLEESRSTLPGPTCLREHGLPFPSSSPRRCFTGPLGPNK